MKAIPKQTKSKLDVGIDDDEGIISTSTKSKKKHQKQNQLKHFISQLQLKLRQHIFQK